jgi:predicted DNA-binding protein YlxM (UPF0122 family)
MVEKLVEIGSLFDFYGKLLSEKQYLVIELYYINDLSLTEIGDELGVTRQGIFDLLKRAEQNLYKYEEKLGLVNKFYSKDTNIRNIINISEEILDIIKNNNNYNEVEEKAMMINNISKKILSDSQEVIK